MLLLTEMGRKCEWYWGGLWVSLTAFQHGVWEDWIPLQALNKQQRTAAVDFLRSKYLGILYMIRKRHLPTVTNL